MFCGVASSSRAAAAPKRSGKIREAAEPEGEREGRRPDEDVVRGDPEHLLRVTVRDREQVAVKVHRDLGLSGGPRGEGEQGDVVAAES